MGGPLARAPGLALPRSLVERHSCVRRADPPQLHEPYLAWTRKVDGTTVSRSRSPEQAERYQPWFDNARRLPELVAELHQLAVE